MTSQKLRPRLLEPYRITSCVKGSRSPLSVKKEMATPGYNFGSRPRTDCGENTVGSVVISVSVNRSVPKNGACSATASDPGVNAVLAITPPDHVGEISSAVLIR